MIPTQIILKYLEKNMVNLKKYKKAFCCISSEALAQAIKYFNLIFDPLFEELCTIGSVRVKGLQKIGGHS